MSNLSRFLDAQAPVYENALDELRRGHKETHWMWFIFPQIAGLGHSAMAQRYAIRDSAEARAYLAHPVLGPRLHECCRALLAVEDRTAREIMGQPDDIKLRSSMTLFALAADDDVFSQVLERYFEGHRDPLTVERFDSVV
jgi:uncharacterized protein (DUF1810 family)